MSLHAHNLGFRLWTVGVFLAVALVLTLLHRLNPIWGAISGLCVGLYVANAKR